jgi:hypothetical protein
MPCIVLQATDGNKRLIPHGSPYQLARGETVVGVDNTCGGDVRLISVVPKVEPLQKELQDQIGPGFGDWIRSLATPIATVMGKRGCTTCEARRLVTNAYGKLREQHGQLKALSIIKDLWMLSTTASGDEVLVKLKEVLDDPSRA